MFGGLRKKLEEVVAQANPFDNGRTAATVRAARQVPPAQTVKQPQRSVASKVFDQANIFDNNRTYKQAAPTNTKSGFQQFGQFTGQVARSTIGGTARLLNTAAAQVPQIDATARMVAANVTKNPVAFRNAQNYAQAANQNFRRGQGGLLNVGTLYDAPDAARGDLKTGVKRIGGGAVESGLEVASAGVGGFAGKQLVQQGVKQGIKTQLPRVAGNAVLNTAQGGVAAYNQDASFKDVIKNAALSGGLGTAGDIGLGVGGAGVTKLTTKLAPTVSQAAQSGRNLTTNLVKKAAQVDEALFTPREARLPLADRDALIAYSDMLVGAQDIPNSVRNQLVQDVRRIGAANGFDFATGSVKQQMDNIEQILDGQRAVAQGGYAKVPGFESDLEAAGLTTPKGSAGRQASQPETPGQILKRQSEARTPKTTRGTSQSQSDSSLPVYNTKKVSNLDKAARSTQSIIRRQGKKGEELSGLLDQVRDTKEIYLGELQKKMPSVSKLARKGRNAIVNKDFENFVEAAQGRAKPKNDLVAKAVKEWQATAPTIRQRAVDAGLEVGDLGSEYYPHIIDYDRLFKNKNMYNQAINHLVETGQAKSAEDAIKLLSHAKDISRNREFGNLEASRLVDLPFYDKTPNSFINYLTGSAKRIAQVETLGKGDEKALKLIADAGLEGADTEAMKNAFDVAIGAKQYSPTASKVSGGIRKYVTTTRLGLGALTNISQNVNTGIVTGHYRTLKSAIKQLDPKTREFVGDTGVISDAILNDIKTQSGYSSFTSKVLGKGINKITAPFFGTVEKFNRSVAATAGRDYALRLAQKGDEATLRKLGVTGEIKGKTLTEAQQVQAARNIVQKTQFKVDPQDLPGWADSPGGKLVAQFRTFSYNQGKFFSNEILKPAAKGNLMPAARLIAALPIGYGLYETKRAIAGRPEEEDKKKVALSTFQNIGGAGLVLDLYNSINPLGSKYLPSDRRQSMVTGAVAGPAAGVAIQGIGALSDVVQRKNAPKDESTLEGKVVLGKNDESYTDATAISRFGLQQIPIVGTPIKNRLLPYKAQSNAEAGKTAPEDMNKDQREKYEALPESAKSDFELAFKEGRVTKSGEMKSAEDDATGQARNKILKKKTELPNSMSEESRNVLTRYSRLSDDGKEKFNAKPEEKYKLEQAKYEQDTLEGKVSAVDKIKTERSLHKQKIGLDFGSDIVELDTMSKAQVFDFINRDPNGKDLADKLVAYNDQLLAAGLISDHPYRNKWGDVDFDPDSKSGGSRGSKAGFDYTKDLFASGSDSGSTTKSLRSILQRAMDGKA